jgi:tetratricopeptide (TPR) repeat protein
MPANVSHYLKKTETGRTAMRKIVFFLIVSLIMVSGSAYTEGPDKKPGVDKKDEAKQMVIKGNQSFSARRYDEALTWYNQAIALDPDCVDANYNLGVVYGNKGMYEESIAAYNRVIAISPRHAQAHNNLGSAYEKKGMADKAHSEYEKAAAADPYLAPALYNLGKSFLSKGSRDLAADYLYKAGVLFHKSKNIEWAKKSYDLIKQANSPEREKELSELINPSPKEKKK